MVRDPWRRPCERLRADLEHDERRTVATGEKARQEIVGDHGVPGGYGTLHGGRGRAALAERRRHGVHVEPPEARAPEEERERRAARAARPIEYLRSLWEAHCRRRRVERDADRELDRDDHRGRDREHAPRARGIGSVSSGVGHRPRTGSR
jgi:hypothetical protein